MTAVEYLVEENGRQAFICRCDCGKEKKVAYSNFATGRTKSCGCLADESRRKNRRAHGMTDTPEYRIWQSLLSRCRRKSNGLYKHYGAKGIKVEDRWKSFKNFFYDMGKRPSPKHVIERVSKESNFGPTTCFWRIRDKAVHYRANSHVIELNGQKLTASEAARQHDLCKQTVNLRLQNGRPIDEVLSKSRLKPRGKFEYQGKRYTIKKLAALVGIKPEVLYRRIRAGHSVEHAINFKHGKLFGFRGEQLTLREISERLSIPVEDIRNRLRSGWSLEQISAGASRMRRWEFRGRFISLEEFCGLAEISRRDLNNRRRRGKSLEEIHDDIVTERQQANVPSQTAPTSNFESVFDRLLNLAESDNPNDHLTLLTLLYSSGVADLYHLSWKLRIPPQAIQDFLKGKSKSLVVKRMRLRSLLRELIKSTSEKNSKKAKSPPLPLKAISILLDLSQERALA